MPPSSPETARGPDPTRPPGRLPKPADPRGGFEGGGSRIERRGGSGFCSEEETREMGRVWAVGAKPQEKAAGTKTGGESAESDPGEEIGRAHV